MPSRAVLSSSVSFSRRQQPPRPSGGVGGLHQVAPHRRSLEMSTQQASLPVLDSASASPLRRPGDLNTSAFPAMTRRSSLESSAVGYRSSSPTVMHSRRSLERLCTPLAIPTGSGCNSARSDLNVILDVGGTATPQPLAGNSSFLPPITLGQKPPPEKTKKEGLFARLF